jgi:hypothetical protein
MEQLDKKVISRDEVTMTVTRNIINDQAEFKDIVSPLKHGQKQRLMEAMCLYPLQEIEFEDSEPELRTAYTTWKRIQDNLVALGTEAAIEGIINSFNKESQGEQNVETKE